MKKNDLILYDEQIHRLLEFKNNQVLLINCVKKTMPFFIEQSLIKNCPSCTEEELNLLLKIPNFDTLSQHKKKIAQEKFTLIAPILPLIANEHMRSQMIDYIYKERNISKQTIRKYLCLYLVSQSISSLTYSEKSTKPLSQNEKNFRWALNKFFYTPLKNTLRDTYLLLIKVKYTDEDGNLIENYPKFHQFRYFYLKTKKLQNYFISRNGLGDYQRNHRPLLGEGVREFATSVGVGMLDSTICDIYLVNDEGMLVGRPILTACIDAYSSMCCGYSLSWEGGFYSLKLLIENIVANKVNWCKNFDISIDKTDWDCDKLPAVLVTDKGKEYTSYIFEQLTDLGVSIINLPPYRPELKSCVEKFFDIIQNLYKPLLKGKGVIEDDYQERGATDYRKTACLTLREFEKILLKCIIYYNTQRIIEQFSYTQYMLDEHIKPYANCIWNNSLYRSESNLISANSDTLCLTLLPRTKAKFTRKGLLVNKLRYSADGYTERYLKGGECIVAYDPQNSSFVYLVENGNYTRFSLIDKPYENMSFDSINALKTRQIRLIKGFNQDNLQAKLALISDIELIAENRLNQGSANVVSTRKARTKEKQRNRSKGVKND